MKCPKCEYLGFETGDRCRNCGYEFSLMTDAAIAPAVQPSGHDRDLDLRLRDDDPRPQPPPSFRGEPALPFFSSPDSDEPLIKMPAAPRPPLAVRKTPDTPRLRNLAKHQRTVEEPALLFQDLAEPEPAPSLRGSEPALPSYLPREQSRSVATKNPAAPQVTAPSGLARRAIAAALDHAILLAIDIVVIDFTLRLLSLTWADWRLLPPVPLVAFLLAIKLAYFSAFTAVGGQTIAKMAAGIRVVGDDAGLIEPSRAFRRSLLGAVSLATFGTGLIPVLFGADRRPLHDRVAHTRVVAGSAA